MLKQRSMRKAMKISSDPYLYFMQGGHWKGKIPAREINNGYETYWEKNHERVPLKREKKI